MKREDLSTDTERKMFDLGYSHPNCPESCRGLIMFTTADTKAARLAYMLGRYEGDREYEKRFGRHTPYPGDPPMTREQAYKFLSDLADECERSGLEYGKGRANGIREAVKELWPLIPASSPPAQEGEAVIEQRHRHAAREIWNRIVNSSSATRDVEVIAATLASCERSVRDEFRACGLADKDGKPLKRILPDCEDACTYDEMHGMMHDALGKIQEFIDAGLADAEGKPRVALEIRGTKEHDIFTFAALPAGRGEAP